MRNKNKLKWVGVGGIFASTLAASIAVPLSINNKDNKIIIENKNLKINTRLANDIINPITDWIMSITENELSEYLQNPNYNKQIVNGVSNLFGLDSIYISNVKFTKNNQNNELIITPSQYLTIEFDEEISSSGLPISLNKNGEIVITNLNFVSLINLTKDNVELFANKLIQKVNDIKISQNYFLNQINNEIIYQQIYKFFYANNSGNPIDQYDYIQEISASNNVVTIIPKRGTKFNIISNTYVNNNVVIDNGCIVITDVPFASIVDSNIINLNYRSLINVYNNISNRTPNSTIDQAISLLNEPSNQTQIINYIATNIGYDSSYIGKVTLSNDGIFNIEPANGYEFKLNDDLSSSNIYLGYNFVFSSIKLNAIGNLIFTKLIYQQNNTIIINVDKYYKLFDDLSNATWPSNATISTINNLIKENNAKEKIASLLGIDQALIESVEFAQNSHGDYELNINFPENYYIVFNNSTINIDSPQYATPMLPVNNNHTIPLIISSYELNIYNSIDINKLSNQINLINYTYGGGVFTREYFKKSSSQINGYDGGVLKYSYDYGPPDQKYINFCNQIGIESIYDIDVNIYVDNSNYFNIEIYSNNSWASDIDFGSNGTGTINGRKLTYRQQLKQLTQATNIDISINQNSWAINRSDRFLDYNNVEEIESLINNGQKTKQAFLDAITVSPNNINASQVQNIQLVHGNHYDGTIIKNRVGNIYEHYNVVITPVDGINFNIIGNDYYGVQNNGYLVFNNLILAKTNRIAIDSENIYNLIKNYNSGTSLLNNSSYFNSDGTVKQEYLSEFIKKLLYIGIYDPTTGSVVNNRDDLFTLVPTLKNAFQSFKVSSIGWNNYNNFLNIRVDIQQPMSDFELLPSQYANNAYSVLVGDTISYFHELASKIMVESNNLQKLADELRNNLVNTNKYNVLSFLNDMDYYYNIDVTKKIFALLSPNDSNNAVNFQIRYEYSEQSKKLTIKSQSGCFFEIIPNEATQLNGVTITPDGNIEIENVTFSQNNPNNINVNNFIDLRNKMIEYINQDPNTNWNNLPNLMINNWKQICDYIGIKEWYMLDEIGTIWASYGIFIDLNNANLNLTNEQIKQLTTANIQYTDYAHGNIFNINYIQPDHQKP